MKKSKFSEGDFVSTEFQTQQKPKRFQTWFGKVVLIEKTQALVKWHDHSIATWVPTNELRNLKKKVGMQTDNQYVTLARERHGKKTVGTPRSELILIGKDIEWETVRV